MVPSQFEVDGVEDAGYIGRRPAHQDARHVDARLDLRALAVAEVDAIEVVARGRLRLQVGLGDPLVVGRVERAADDLHVAPPAGRVLGDDCCSRCSVCVRIRQIDHEEIRLLRRSTRRSASGWASTGGTRARCPRPGRRPRRRTSRTDSSRTSPSSRSSRSSRWSGRAIVPRSFRHRSTGRPPAPLPPGGARRPRRYPARSDGDAGCRRDDRPGAAGDRHLHVREDVVEVSVGEDLGGRRRRPTRAAPRTRRCSPRSR